MFHDFYDNEPLHRNEAADVCPHCGAYPVAFHGAYACGWPSADCPVGVAAMEDAYEAEEQASFWTAGDDEEDEPVEDFYDDADVL